MFHDGGGTKCSTERHEGLVSQVTPLSLSLFSWGKCIPPECLAVDPLVYRSVVAQVLNDHPNSFLILRKVLIKVILVPLDDMVIRPLIDLSRSLA